MNIIHFYFQVSDYQHGKWIPVSRVCGRNFPEPINSTSNVMKVRFHSDNKTVGDGFVVSLIKYTNILAHYTKFVRSGSL